MVTIRENFALDDTATGMQTGTVGEPSAAASRTGIFLAGNWYASRSADAGGTWTFVDPFAQFPQDHGSLCCDQLVVWAPGAKLWIWLLQYEKSGSSNIFRVAVSRDTLTWHSLTLTPTDLDPAWTTAWFDYPDVEVSDQHLWISYNQYDSHDQWLRAVVVRYPLTAVSALADGSTDPVPREHWTSTDFGSLRFTTGATDTMWWAANDVDASTLHVFAWPDESTSVETWTVHVHPWSADDYASLTPGGGSWLSRCDDRVTGGWRVGTGTDARLGWAWTSGRGADRPHPFVRAVVVAEDDLSVVTQPDLWSPNGAWAYPAAAPSQRQKVGLTAFFGGPSDFPAHCVGVLDEAGTAWTMKRAATSTHGPSDGKWGDYLTIRPHPRRPTSWIAAGFTLQGGQDRRNVEPRVVVFRD
jgi:hypothetical protein